MLSTKATEESIIRFLRNRSGAARAGSLRLHPIFASIYDSEVFVRHPGGILAGDDIMNRFAIA
jgi:hypothetical protein